MKHLARNPVLSTLLSAAIFCLAGCNDTPRRDPEYAASLPAPVLAPEQRNGAIYQAGTTMALFEDPKAHRIGDTLTIHLVENNNATKSASATANKSTATTIANPTILGTQPQFGLPGVLPLASTSNNTLATNISAADTFSGKGDEAQKNSLTGDISVTVADVLPNGNLVIRGEKRMNLNQGNEYIKISGIVRPFDIAADNSVPSTKIADATLIYNGDGQLTDSSKLGWLGRFFMSALSPL